MLENTISSEVGILDEDDEDGDLDGGEVSLAMPPALGAVVTTPHVSSEAGSKFSWVRMINMLREMIECEYIICIGKQFVCKITNIQYQTTATHYLQRRPIQSHLPPERSERHTHSCR